MMRLGKYQKFPDTSSLFFTLNRKEVASDFGLVGGFH